MHPVLRRRSFFRGRPVGAAGVKDLTWLRADGEEMTDAEWHDPNRRVLGMLIHGEAADETDDRGRPVRGDTMLLIINAGFDPVDFTLPAVAGAGTWTKLIDTVEGQVEPAMGPTMALEGFSLALLRHGVERRIGWTGATAESAALVNAATVGGASGLAAAELSLMGIGGATP